MEKTNQLLSLQDDRYQQITKAQINYRKSPKSRINLEYVDARLENLEKTWQTFKTAHDQLVAYVSKDQKSAVSYFTEDIYDNCEETYLSYKSELKSKAHELKPIPEPHPKHENKKSSTEIKLPTINIPTFTGKYTDWPSFHDLYETIIHTNENLENVQKLHYLKSCLSGEAEILLKCIPVTSNNYELAWGTLKNRYNNKRYISNCIFRKLFGLRNITTESSLYIKQLLDTTVECLNSLQNLGLPTEKWDAFTVYLTVSKLDIDSQKQWEQHISSVDSNIFPTFNSLKQFLETRFRALEMIEPSSRSVKPKTFHTTMKTNNSNCSYCQKEDHYIYQCKEFGKQHYKARLEFVQKNNLCYNCLMANHSFVNCLRQTTCRICQRKHHSLLHRSDAKEPIQDRRQGNSTENIVSHFINQPGQILLATALVDVVSNKGCSHIYRALIDQGSQASFVTEDLVQTLGLKRIKINGVVSGLSEGNTLQTKYMVEVQLKSRHENNFTIPVKAHVLKKITNYLPTQQILVSNWPMLDDLKLADPSYNIPNKISLLLGAEVYGEIIDTGLLKSPSGIIAQKTHLGWILSGDATKTNPGKQKHMISLHLSVNESDILRKFWEIENETLNSERTLTKEEQKAEEIYKNTTIKTESGKYKVNLPFKDATSPVIKCGKTKEIATTRFLQLERRFKKDVKLKDEYTKVIHEYLQLGHMVPVTDNDDDAIYLPHHAVIRTDKDTTKVRVVFDASSRGSLGSSLNDTLLVGPVIQSDLRVLIMKWRQYPIAIVSDVIKMYRQILVDEKHTDYQRILWRDEPNKICQSYKLLTVTFGTSSAPFLAVRTLKQAADDAEHKYPLAAEIIRSSFYMDDLLTGAANEKDALEIFTQVKEVMKSAGFELQKWASNSSTFLNNIQKNKVTDNEYEIRFDTIVKTLGLYWDRIDDKFKFSITLSDLTLPITKRTVLAEVARLFDPFGWLAPVIVKAKIIIQNLWLCTAGWDEPLPPNLEMEWLEFRKSLPKLQKLSINRWIHTNLKTEVVELHGFADASTSAYAAVLYVRVVQDDEVNVSILESKTKVAPLKQISVARLELCAALLLAKLLAETSHVLKIPKDHVFAYTDSMVVLAWIEAQPLKWQTFVANRVTEIQNRLDNNQWSHVASAENPADLASRGVDPSHLQQQKIWWRGPDWLNRKRIQRKRKIIPETNLEERKSSIKVYHTTKTEEKMLCERFSNLHRMLRVLTFCRRFLNLKRKGDTLPTYLTSKELRETLDTCIKLSQAKEYSEEIKDLKEKGKIKKRSRIIALSPYLASDGFLRVGGRLQAAKLSQERIHPILIPNTHLATLLVRDAHKRLLHGSNALVMNYLRSRYWIIGLKPLVKRCYRECTTCIRYKTTTVQPQMGELPAVRITPGRPFETSGVDFAGPIQMRVSKGRGQKSYKGYICIFVCMKTKAIHIEVVSDLTTSGFLAAYRRFVSRRGHCTDLYSDNGLNFVGAAKELTKMLNQSMNHVVKEVVELLQNDGVKWHFIPPKAPNFGGIWEAGVKAVKTHLIKTIGDSTLTFEEMTTLLNQIEACLNSRPIGHLSDHPDDISPLTPAHFLVGGPLVAIPEKHDKEEYISPLHRWKLLQRMLKHFWDRWSIEFLHTMQQRYKWQAKSVTPQIGDVVIIKETDLPPTKWLLGRIEQVHKGPDDEIRVVTIKCKHSTLKRPTSKLIFLPRELGNVN